MGYAIAPVITTVPMTKVEPPDICPTRCFDTERVEQTLADMLSDDTLEIAQILFNALADKSRLKILYALGNGQELCVCDISVLLGVKVATTSHQLRKLRDLKILKHRNEGKLVYYSLRDPRISDILNFALSRLID